MTNLNTQDYAWLTDDDIRELGWVADVLEAGANGAQPDQGYEQAARDLAGVIRSKLPEEVDPVVQFKPGDVVRATTNSAGFNRPITEGVKLALSDTGFVNLTNGTFYEYGGENGDYPFLRLEEITSAAFELVQ